LSIQSLARLPRSSTASRAASYLRRNVLRIRLPLCGAITSAIRAPPAAASPMNSVVSQWFRRLISSVLPSGKILRPRVQTVRYRRDICRFVQRGQRRMVFRLSCSRARPHVGPIVDETLYVVANPTGCLASRRHQEAPYSR
jgi:hypothetical protein